MLGHDPRLQFLHEEDLLGVLQHAVVTDVAGTFNVAGDGVLMLSQAIRRLSRPSVPLPAFAVGGVGSALRSARVADFSPEQLGFLTYGRGVDTTRMRTVLGFEPGVHHRGGVRRLRGRVLPPTAAAERARRAALRRRRVPRRRADPSGAGRG